MEYDREYESRPYDLDRYERETHPSPRSQSYEPERYDREAYGQEAYEREARPSQRSQSYDTGRHELDPYQREARSSQRGQSYDTGRFELDPYQKEARSSQRGQSYDSESYDHDPYERKPHPSSNGHKKKRSKFSRFLRALGKYMAQMPARAFAVIGGSVMVVLVAVILLVMLLPGGRVRNNDPLGNLAIGENSPTPSIAPVYTREPTLEPVPTPDPDPMNGQPIDKVGIHHPAVPGIQQRLVELGYMDMPEGGYTDFYGPATKNGVRRFQLRNDLKVDGQVGTDTYNLLMGDTAKGFWMKRGDTDDSLYVDKIDGVVQEGLVTKLQNRLIKLGYMTGSPTGKFGESTRDAVKLFQQYHGLTPIDGLAGQTTLKLLYSNEAMDAVTGKANDRSKITPVPGADTTAPGPTTNP